ncbi:MAG: hypothetical protein LBE38_07955 [Deltaproteobacteria bacterium]|jgi:hypothetical protein|nr:hypothetical protein [Deltaproteobacteria bacterium]
MNDFKVDGYISTEVNPDSVTQADIVLGIYADNCADNIELCVTKTAGGLDRYYPDKKSVLVNLDLCSSDDTKDVFFKCHSEVPRIYVSTSPEDRIKKHSFFNLVTIAHRLKAKAVLVFDGSIASIKKTWVPRLLEPIFKHNASFTSPLYSRQHFDLPVTQLLSYPLFRALFGRRIRNPNLGDAAFSGALNEVFFNTTSWPAEESYFAIELTMAVLAVAHGPIYQSFMGDPRVGKKRLIVDSSQGIVFTEILNSFYELMLLYAPLWLKARHSRPTSIIGTDIKPEILPPRELTENFLSFQHTIQQLSIEHEAIWTAYFPKQLELLKSLKSLPIDRMEIPVENWADLIYTGALRFRNLDHSAGRELVNSLIPPFLVRLINFSKLLSTIPSGQMNALIEQEGVVFEKMKPQLVAAWNNS